MKLFVLLVVILLFVLWKKNQTRQKTWGERLNETLKEGLFKKDSPFNNSTTTPRNANSAQTVDELIACSVCGVHTPKSQLVLGRNQQYQCAKHS